MTTTPNLEQSNCCNAPVIIRSGDEGTSYYECSQCGKPCDIGSIPVERVSNQTHQTGNLEQEIEKILKEYIKETLIEGKNKPLIRRAIRHNCIETIFSLFSQTITECLPEKIDMDYRDKLHLYEGDEGQYWYDKGQSDTIDTITTNLKEKGVIQKGVKEI